MKKPIHPTLLTLSEDFIRSVTNRWREEGHQDTPEHVIKAAALKVAKAMQSTYVPPCTSAAP